MFKKMADSVTMNARKSSWILFIWGDLKNVLPVEVNNVQESTVGDLKSLIQEQSGIPATEQNLFLGKVLLSRDALKLQDVRPELKDGSSVCLAHVRVWFLTIQDRSTSKKISLKVPNPQGVTINHLKRLVQADTNIAPYEQKLIHMEGGRLQLLHEEDALDERELYLHDYPSLSDGSTIILMHSPTWKIHVEYLQGKSFTLQISPETTPMSLLKTLIHERTGLLPHSQVLKSYRYNSPMKYCDDQMCLDVLEDKATILLERFPGWRIYIRMVDGSTTVITVENFKEITVPDLKVIIGESTNIPAYEQRLSDNHTILEDIYIDSQEHMEQRCLKHYPGVGDESVLYLVRLTGTNFKVSLPSSNLIFYINFTSNDVSLEEVNDLLLQKTHHQYDSLYINGKTFYLSNRCHHRTLRNWSQITYKNGATLTLRDARY